jgi:signal transduction histidine kinase
MESLSTTLEQPSPQTDISSALLDLNVAENDFQKASDGGNAQSLDAYTEKLKDVFNQISHILTRYDRDQKKYFSGSKQQIASALQQKMEVSQRLFELKRHFDSLIKVTNINNINAGVPHIELPKAVSHFKTGKTDTSVTVRTEADKSGLFKRLKNAIANKNNVKVLTIRQKQDSILASRYKQLQKHGLLSQLSQQYKDILKLNQDLTSANLNLLNEVHQLLVELQDIDNIAYQNARELALSEYRQTTSDLNTFTGVTSVFLIIFVILLIIYIQRAARAEQNYQVENERSIQLAGEKSEILAIMSHEIRNRLTAISGATYMLNKTNLSDTQKEKVSAINLSSDTLVKTLNQVLDITKLEEQPTDILKKDSFKPIIVVDDVVTAMRFMAENKGLGLKTNYNGDINLTVEGDQLRLSQVITNLLSNAIKYTDQGYVKVNANLNIIERKAIFLMEVSDTGIGIPKKHQPRLFTRYYQAGGKRPGTGLGLYLCKQLVELQNGTIKLDSEEGKGCTVTFTLPYSIKENL